MAEINSKKNTKYVRLTKNEYIMLTSLKKGDIFYHVNLQHLRTNHYKNGTIFEAVEIIKKGLVTKSKVINPTLELLVPIQLKLLETTKNISVKDLKKVEGNEFFLFENKKGLYESLVDRYSKVFGFTKEDILKMSCYIRKFVIL